MKRYFPFALLFVLLSGFTTTTDPALNGVAARVAKDSDFKQFAGTGLKLLEHVHAVLKEKKELIAELRLATPERKKELVQEIAALVKATASELNTISRKLDKKLEDEYRIPAKDKPAVLKISLEEFLKENMATKKITIPVGDGCISGYVNIVVSYSLELADCINFGVDPARCYSIFYEWLVAEFTWLEMENPGCLQLLINNI